MPIITLDDKPPAPAYPVGHTFTMPRSAWSREMITATVETARWTKCGWVHTLHIDSGKRYGHWRVMFETQISRQAIKPAEVIKKAS